MAVADDALAAWTQMQQGPANEYVQQQSRTTLPAGQYSPHQLLTGGGVPPAGEYSDPTPTATEPAVEPVPNQTAAHAGTNTLGREDA